MTAMDMMVMNMKITKKAIRTLILFLLIPVKDDQMEALASFLKTTYFM